MITVEIFLNQSGDVYRINSYGHAGYKEQGSDIICASVSTLIYTCINAIISMSAKDDFYSIVETDSESPDVEINVPDGISDEVLKDVRTIFETIRIGLTQLGFSVNDEYGKNYLKVIEKKP